VLETARHRRARAAQADLFKTGVAENRAPRVAEASALGERNETFNAAIDAGLMKPR